MLKYSIGATDPVWGELMKQITRLEQLDRFPQGPQAKKDLGCALARVDSLEEARAVIDEFTLDARAGQRCPLAGDIAAMIDHRRSRTGKPREILKPTPPPPSSTHCSRCGGFGYCGGAIAGPHAGPWKWCDCVNARRKRYEEPELINQANQAREKLLIRSAPRTLAAADDLHGNF